MENKAAVFRQVLEEFDDCVPISPRKVIPVVMQRTGLSEHQTRALMWCAIDQNVIDITRDWLLTFPYE